MYPETKAAGAEGAVKERIRKLQAGVILKF
jgi:hypothetical protein